MADPGRFLFALLTALVIAFPGSLAGDPSAAYHVRSVTIWSDGTRMAGDLYIPNGLAPDEKRPAILFCAGTGGTKRGNGARYGQRFAQEGFVVLAFDYRGWGESDAKLMLLEPMPKPDATGAVTVKARPIRWQMDFADQTFDIRCAINFLAGEPCVDARRIGIMGSSYGGGLVIWTAGNDPRVKCVVAQVPGLRGGRGPAADRYASALAIRQARGETEPVPYETGKLTGKLAAYAQMRTNPAKAIGYSPLEAAEKITAPTLFVVAANDQLVDNDENGKQAFDLLTRRDIPTEYHVIPGIGHYGVYSGRGFTEATQLEVAWFKRYLAPPLPPGSSG